jgi:hypothetical protein
MQQRLGPVPPPSRSRSRHAGGQIRAMVLAYHTRKALGTETNRDVMPELQRALSRPLSRGRRAPSGAASPVSLRGARPRERRASRTRTTTAARSSDDGPEPPLAVAATVGGYPVRRVAPLPEPTLISSSVAEVLANRFGTAFAAGVLASAIREMPPAVADERLRTAPPDVARLVLDGAAS